MEEKQEEKNKTEMTLTHKVIQELCDYQINLFAPPSGSYSSTTIKVAQDIGYKTIMWSRDTIDWRDKDRDTIFRRATEKTQCGDLILMHPTEKTAEALEDIILALQNKGLSLTTVSQTIA